MIHLHRWAKWADIELVIHPYGRPSYPTTGQIKVCTRCGKKKTREIT